MPQVATTEQYPAWQASSPGVLDNIPRFASFMQGICERQSVSWKHNLDCQRLASLIHVTLPSLVQDKAVQQLPPSGLLFHPDCLKFMRIMHLGPRSDHQMVRSPLASQWLVLSMTAVEASMTLNPITFPFTNWWKEPSLTPNCGAIFCPCLEEPLNLQKCVTTHQNVNSCQQGTPFFHQSNLSVA